MIDFEDFTVFEDKCTYHYINPCRNGGFRIPQDCNKAGNEFYFEGILDKNAEKFSVKFCDTEDGNGQFTAFEYVANIRDSRTVLYGIDKKREEGFRFKTSSAFFLCRIVIREGYYELSVNNQSPKRQNVSRRRDPTHVVICGDVTIRSFHMHRDGPQTSNVYMSIPGNVRIGDIFTIRGISPPNKKRSMFSFIKFCSGEDHDIIFHIDNDFEYLCCDDRTIANHICRNTYANGVWQKDETGGGMPLKPEQPYKMDILVEKEHFRILVDNCEFCVYKHRLPFCDITHLLLRYEDYLHKKPPSHELKSVVLTRINRRIPNKFPFKLNQNIEDAHVCYFPSIPMEQCLPVVLEIKSCICISGVFTHTKDFKLRLKSPKDTIYEMAVDFEKFSIDESPVQRSKTQTDADSETRRSFPLKFGGHFDMQILCLRNDELCLIINDAVISTTCLVQPYAKAKTISIDGMVWIKSIAFVCKECEKCEDSQHEQRDEWR